MYKIMLLFGDTTDGFPDLEYFTKYVLNRYYIDTLKPKNFIEKLFLTIYSSTLKIYYNCLDAAYSLFLKKIITSRWNNEQLDFISGYLFFSIFIAFMVFPVFPVVSYIILISSLLLILFILRYYSDISDALYLKHLMDYSADYRIKKNLKKDYKKLRRDAFEWSFIVLSLLKHFSYGRKIDHDSFFDSFSKKMCISKPGIKKNLDSLKKKGIIKKLSEDTYSMENYQFEICSVTKREKKFKMWGEFKTVRNTPPHLELEPSEQERMLAMIFECEKLTASKKNDIEEKVKIILSKPNKKIMKTHKSNIYDYRFNKQDEKIVVYRKCKVNNIEEEKISENEQVHLQNLFRILLRHARDT